MHKVTLYGEPRGRVIAVMVVFNGMEFLKAGIESTLAELGPDNSLLVVDNDSTDGSFEFVRENYPEVCVLQTHDNLGGAGGFSAGMFVAMEVPDNEFIWLLDNDILVEGNALQPLVQCLEDHPDAAAAGSQICLYSDPDTIQEVGATYTAWLGDIQGNHRGEKRLQSMAPFQVDYTAACSTLIRNSVAHDIGRFADIFIFYDDIDWALRAGKAGYSVWAVPESVIRHNYSGLKPIVPWREYYRKRNRAYCLSQHPTRKLGLVALYVYLVFLNHVRLTHRYAGSPTLAVVYSAALTDFMNRRPGKSDRPEVTPGQPAPASATGRQTVLIRARNFLVKAALLPACAALGAAQILKLGDYLGSNAPLELQFEQCRAGIEA